MCPRLVQANIYCDTAGPNGTWENIATQWNLMEASVNFFAAAPHRTKDVTAMVECRRQDTQRTPVGHQQTACFIVWSFLLQAVKNSQVWTALILV